jgi:hypothetical protein
MAAISLWVLSFQMFSPNFDEGYRRSDILGAKKYIGFNYFYYHFNYFPVTSEIHTDYYLLKSDIPNPTKSELEDIIENEGSTLATERLYDIRYGDWGRMFLYFFNSKLMGSTENVTYNPINKILFWIALISLFSSFAAINRLALGTILTVLLGSSPTLLSYVFQLSNIHCLQIILAILLLAINVPLMLNARLSSRYRLYYYVAPLISGVLVALMATIRMEFVVIAVSVVLVYLFACGLSSLKKITLCLILIVSTVGLKTAITNHLDHKYEEASRIVEEAGGVVFDRKVIQGGHPLWHAVFCGLGDFGKDKGYEWKDRFAYSYAFPELEKTYKQKYGIDLDYRGSRMLGNTYDETGRFPMKMEDFPEYMDILTRKMKKDFSEDPIWVLSIYARRTWVALVNLSPVHLSIGKVSIYFPYLANVLGVLLLPAAFFLYRRRDYFELKLLLFTLPLATTTILLMSGENNSYASVFHLILLAMLISHGIHHYNVIPRLKNLVHYRTHKASD